MVKFLKTWWLPAVFICLPLDRIPSLTVYVGSHSATLHLSMLVAIIGIGLFGMGLIKHLKLSPSSPYFWLLIYILVMLLSAVTSIDKSRSLIVIVATVLTISTGVIVSQIVRLSDLPRVQRWLCAVTVVVAAFGVYQFIGDSFGLSTSLTGLRSIYTARVFGFPRIQSTELEPLFFANYMLFPTLLVAALALARRGRNSSLYLYAQLFLFVLVLSLTLSRGGIIGGIAGLVVAAVLLYRSISVSSVALVLGTVVIAALVALGAIYTVTAASHHSSAKGGTAVKRYVAQSTNLTVAAGSSDSDRVVDKRLATQAFHARPLLGYGIGSFGTYAKLKDPKFYPASGNSPTVNDEYLEVLAETGILGAVALFGFVLTLAWRVYEAWRRSLSQAHRTWLAALIAAAVAYAIQYYAFSTLYIPHIWVVAGLLLAVTAPAFTTSSARHGKATAASR